MQDWRKNKQSTLNVTGNERLLQKEIAKFNKTIKELLEYLCTCCHRILYKISIQIFKENNYDTLDVIVQKALHPIIHKLSANGMEDICKTCHKDLKSPQPKLPCQAVANGLQITPLPHELQHLNDLE